MNAPPKTFDLPIEIEEIKRCIPHRYPFLLIDRVIDLTVGESIVATKAVSYSDVILQGHFPDQPIVPGVVQVEGMAQASGILAYFSSKANNTSCKLADISSARFRKPVVPGDLVHYHVKALKIREPFFWFEAEARVDGAVVSLAKFSAKVE